MKKLSRALLYVLGALLVLLAGLLLAVNLYVQSQGTQARIQDELSRRIGARLRIDRISVTPWWGLKLTGITIPQDASTTLTEQFLEAQTFRLRVRFSSLFSGELVIKEISLVNPTVYWAQNETGKWRLPATVAPEPGTASPEPAEPADEGIKFPPPAPAQESQPATPEPTPAAPSAPSFTPEIKRVQLTNGNFHFLDAQGRTVATFSAVGFRSTFRRTAELRGDVSVAEVSLRDRFFLKQLKSPITYAPGQLEFSRIGAEAAGGEIAGDFSMRPADPGSPFRARVNFREVQANRLVREAGGPAGMIQGRIEGELEAAGKTADPNALTGAGEIRLRDGQVREYSLLVALGQLLRIDELSQLRFEEAHVKYHITPGVVLIDELMLSSTNLRVTARGTLGFDGRLRLDSRLAVDDRVRGQLLRGMRESFQPTEEPGFAALDFKITGTLQKPKTDLVGKLVGRDLNDLGGIISGFFGGGRKEKRKPAEASAPAAEPEAIPTPAGEQP